VESIQNPKSQIQNWLTKAILKSASLKSASLKGTIFDRANLEGADLTGVKNLTREQLASCCNYEKAILPNYLVIEINVGIL
jgi:uncharacterized protein YjbI with pentapeptide repeats